MASFGLKSEREMRRLVHELSPEQLFERFWEIYEAGEWEPETRELIDATLRPGDLFVDVGAWIGPVTLWALERGASVIAVEPDPVALPELRRRVPDSVEIWEGAVAVRSGAAELTANHGLGLGKSVSRLASEGGGIPVRTWTLPEILDGRVPALVKVDIEGYETDLLPAIAPFLAAAGVPLQVALHGALPEADWFSGYGEVRVPTDPHGTLVARP
jgi:FkbM family methyltransferase